MAEKQAVIRTTPVPRYATAMGGKFVVDTETFTPIANCALPADADKIVAALNAEDDRAAMVGALEGLLSAFDPAAANRIENARALIARFNAESSATEKRFRAHWSEDFVSPGTEEVGIDFFSEGNGYSAADIAAIEKLAVGEVWTCPEWGPSHTVTRIALRPVGEHLAQAALKTATDLARLHKESAPC